MITKISIEGVKGITGVLKFTIPPTQNPLKESHRIEHFCGLPKPAASTDSTDIVRPLPEGGAFLVLYMFLALLVLILVKISAHESVPTND